MASYSIETAKGNYQQRKDTKEAVIQGWTELLKNKRHLLTPRDIRFGKSVLLRVIEERQEIELHKDAYEQITDSLNGNNGNGNNHKEAIPPDRLL